MKKLHTQRNHEVDLFLEALDHPLKQEILHLREIILAANSKITEHIKWNAPSFCYGGDDRVTMKIFPPQYLQLIFHRGAKVKAIPANRLINDPSGMLDWKANDRAVATFKGMDDIAAGQKDLVLNINSWLLAAEE